MVRTQISLTEEQYAAVKGIAAERGVSLSAVIRETVDNLVVLSRRNAADGFLSIAGIGDSGRVDIAVNHDEYLYGDLRDDD
jgi:hypothetical protein